MIERVRVNNISQINKIVHAASCQNSDVGIHDANGQIADAKSLLGLLRLDYSRPVEGWACCGWTTAARSRSSRRTPAPCAPASAPAWPELKRESAG